MDGFRLSLRSAGMTSRNTGNTIETAPAHICAMSAVTHDPPRESHETIRALGVLGAFFFVVAVISYLVTMSWSDAIPRDGTSLVVGRDFLNFWMYGRAAFTPDPSRFYDLAEYHRALDALLGPNYPGQN
jgi:hypothetical protein